MNKALTTALGMSLLFTGCTVTQSGPQPQVTVSACGGNHVLTVQVHNTDTTAHRYTVNLAVDHDEMTTDESVSSELVPAGAKVTVVGTEDQRWQTATCRVAGVNTLKD